ncbi:hypothetical protein RJ639_042713 [Escallonia herrerae]|uniref:Reverse transcriptase/retrotransposon-derived protein RNase H-like domain-containing protein n=1 Tax=Escallonia herrerae TaxID=1293975 RepID=A0AA88WAT5_9ASTE|nr:hypothetical protein RJ639_042713 [Escallonia herrerae]
MRGPAERRDTQLYCHFHKDHGHTTEECKVLQREIENLIAKGYLKQFIKTNQPQNRGRNPPRRANEAPPKDPPVINTISGGPSAGGDCLKAYARQVNLTQRPPERARAPASLEFNDSDLEGVSLPHDDALVITLRIDAFQVKRILVDTGSALAPVKGIASLTVVVGEVPQQATHTLDFLIVKVKSSYNGILGRTGLNRLQDVASTYHLLMKFPTPRGVGFVKGDQTLARRWYIASCRPEETLSIDDQHDETTARRAKPVEALIDNIKNFEWTTECQASFDSLKEYLASPPLLSKPVLGEELFQYLAVAESAVSAILVREEAARQLPIYYVSKVL